MIVLASVTHQHRSKPTKPNMKLIIVAALALVALASAAPIDSSKDAVIVRSESDLKPDGSYNNAFETSDGTQRQETGELKEALDEENKPHTVVVVRGSYKYNDIDGLEHSVSYTADENGFQPISDDIPKQPEPVARR